ncbi:MAG: helix-turn-helix transcriptional regulator [Clostridia bacterium]|nr:helix-turn-helix transcriptional regulator [Clostridia bacterium]
MECNFYKNKIKELRQEKGLSQRELAKQTGIKQANISRWEAGQVVPNVIDVWTLANFFDCSIDYLVGKDPF